MPVDVCWVNYNPNAIARGYWDNELPERILKGQRHYEQQGGAVSVLADGIVLVVPGQHNAEHVHVLNALMADYDWVVLMVTGDEEGLFPWSKLDHPNMRTWAFMPAGEGYGADRLLPIGPTPHGFHDLPKTLDWFYAGQVNTPERKAMAQALRGLEGGKLVETDGFARGLSVEEYVTVMNRARVVPCPPAWKHPDSFRIWEALDAGALPVIVWPTTDYLDQIGYEPQIPTMPGIEACIPVHIDERFTPTRAKAWWLQQQYTYRRWLRDDILALGGPDIAPPITVVVSTSPIPSHPSVRIINETLSSIHQRLDAPVIVMADGVRPEQEHRRADYDTYLRELVRLPGVIPVIYDIHLHQAEMLRQTLQMVDSPYVLFVEHDTPLTGQIPWDTLTEGLEQFDMIRLLHETDVHAEHAYLHASHPKGQFLRTQQWSQRPHLARTDYYRQILEECFTPDSRIYIEDVMHGQAQVNPDRHRLAIYYPEGSKLRSTHLDGRADDPKYEMVR